MKNKVFIGMIAYNGQKYISEAVDSLLNQSFSDFTLFISDDASTDKTEEICREYAKKDSRIIYYRQEKNIGMFPNFKFVLDKADAPYFMWASQDDLWEKDFIKVCLENIENKKSDAATTVTATIDSYGRNLIELTEMTKLSGKPSAKQVAKYVLQPEILGKCNLMYSLFKTDIIKKIWEIYPQKMEWGSDYHFSLATVSHFNIFVDKRILFKKHYGGASGAEPFRNNPKDIVKKNKYQNPKNHIFPFGRFKQYFIGHMKALKGTPYHPLVILLLFIRLPRSFLIYMKERNYKKFIKKIIPGFLVFSYTQYKEIKKNQENIKKYKNFTAHGSVLVTGDCAFEEDTSAGNDVVLMNVSLGKHSYLSGENRVRNCTIGKFCSIGSRVRIGLGAHPSKDMVSTHPAFFADKKHKRFIYADSDYIQEFDQTPPITIGNDVWIGENAMIKDGVSIGDGAIIGAGAVVVKNVEPYAVVGGVPAKLIRYRFSPEEISFLLKFKWWDYSDEWLRKNWKNFFDIKTFISKQKKEIYK